jgi:hypothetical protein
MEIQHHGKKILSGVFSMSTDKKSYADIEVIMMTFKIFNYTEEEITFHLSTSQRYEFIIEGEQENKI